MFDLYAADLLAQSPEHGERHGGVMARRRQSQGASCGSRATVAIAPEEFQAELACGCQAGPEQAEPYEEGFAAYAAGVGIAENPYHGDNCAHQQWANGWSQARDEAQRQAR